MSSSSRPADVYKRQVQYGSLDNIYAHLDEISKKSIRESLAENKDLADLSKVLATIHTDCDLDVTWDMVSMQDVYKRQVL